MSRSLSIVGYGNRLSWTAGRLRGNCTCRHVHFHTAGLPDEGMFFPARQLQLFACHHLGGCLMLRFFTSMTVVALLAAVVEGQTPPLPQTQPLPQAQPGTEEQIGKK